MSQILILTLFIMNIAILAIPMQDEDFSESDNLFATILRGLGYKSQKSMGFHHIPTLTDSQTSSQNEITFGSINARISDYYVPGWADSRWQYRKNITIDSSKVSTDLSNFPAFIELYDSDLQKYAQASGNDIFFAVTGITDGELVDGVKYFGQGARTHSLVMRSRSGTTREIRSTHRWEKLMRYSEIIYDPSP